MSLQTIPILVRLSEGRELVITCLLDDGAQSSFVTRSLARKLHLKGFRCDYVSRTVGGSSTKQSPLYTQVFITSLTISGEGLEVIEPIQVWAVDDTILVYKSVDWNELVRDFPHLEEVDVAPLPSENIDILIGNDVPELKISLRELVPPHNFRGPVARLTPLGWSVIGPVVMYPKNHILAFDTRIGDFQDIDGNVFDVVAAQAGSVPES